MLQHDTSTLAFGDLHLPEMLLHALKDEGYTVPTPIQSSTIPHMLAGTDVIAQAQTGTGKTAAFALPLLSRIEMAGKMPQVLILTPTRELAIQLTEAFRRYAAHMPGFRVVPIYGGQSYDIQFNELRRGAHVVIGTPGRVMDHMRRGTLNLESLKGIVLDEADEMLHMGFIDDVQWVMDRTPPDRQVALFSATMPTSIRRVAKKYLRNPKEITFEVKATAADTIVQRYIITPVKHKFDALTRILEYEHTEGVIVFVRTKVATQEVSDQLEAIGFRAAALNGDLAQRAREYTVGKLKASKLDILVATDVAARGLDVERLSHVINYDCPHDTEAYVHRIGRTGRAGRSGQSVIFLTPREKMFLKVIERSTKQKIDEMPLPTAKQINKKRIEKFGQEIQEAFAAEDISVYRNLIEKVLEENSGITPLDAAASLVKMIQGNKPLLLEENPPKWNQYSLERENPRNKKFKSQSPDNAKRYTSNSAMETFYVQVGSSHGVKTNNIVGAIANEASLASEFIGKINIYETYSTVDLPKDMPKRVLGLLKTAWVCDRQLNISKTPLSNDELSFPAKLQKRRSTSKLKKSALKKKVTKTKRKTKKSTQGKSLKLKSA